MRRGHSAHDVPASGSAPEMAGSVFECPADFEPSTYTPLGGLTAEKAKSSSTEVWLIQAPADFSPQCLTDTMVPLVGFDRVTLDNEKKRYNIMSTCQGLPKTGVLLPTEKGGALQWAPVLSGIISIAEEAGGTVNGGGKIHPIHDPPPPSIPGGLRQRYKPFGHSTPARAPKQGADAGESARKKRKSSRLAVKDEPNRGPRANEDGLSRETSRDRSGPAAPHAAQVKVEPEEAPGDGRRRKKKKKNKERDREVAGQAAVDRSGPEARVKVEAAEERDGDDARPGAKTSDASESPLLRPQVAVGENEEEEEVGKESRSKKKKKKSKQKDREEDKEEAPPAAAERSDLSEGARAAAETEHGSNESRARKKNKKSKGKERSAAGEGVYAAGLTIKNEPVDRAEVTAEAAPWETTREDAASAPCPRSIPDGEEAESEPSVRKRKKKRREKERDDAGAETAGHVDAGIGTHGDPETVRVKLEDDKEVRRNRKKMEKEERERAAVERGELPSDTGSVDEQTLKRRSKHKRPKEEIPDAGERVCKNKKMS